MNGLSLKKEGVLADLKHTAELWRHDRRRYNAKLSSDEARVLYEVAVQLVQKVPPELLHREWVIRLLGPKLFQAEQCFRLASVGQLPEGAEFDSGETTLLRRLPSQYTLEELAYIVAVTTVVRAVRRVAEATFGLEKWTIDYLADAFMDHGKLVGRAFHLIERATVETDLAIWHAAAPKLLAQVPAHTRELSFVHRITPGDIRRAVLCNTILIGERHKAYQAVIAHPEPTFHRTNGAVFDELDVWKELFPEGADLYPLECRTIIP